jgi:hypothetical protein
VGDAVVVNPPPFLANADLDAWLEVLSQLLSQFGDYLIIGGRGGAATGEGIRALQRFLKNVIKNIDRVSKRSSTPEATEGLVPALLSEFSFPEEQRELYYQRLRYGLYQYFARKFRMSTTLEQQRMEDSEQ